MIIRAVIFAVFDYRKRSDSRPQRWIVATNTRKRRSRSLAPLPSSVASCDVERRRVASRQFDASLRLLIDASIERATRVSYAFLITVFAARRTRFPRDFKFHEDQRWPRLEKLSFEPKKHRRTLASRHVRFSLLDRTTDRGVYGIWRHRVCKFFEV